jgi:tRNA threonylcarbamoyladenosine dehydratase
VDRFARTRLLIGEEGLRRLGEAAVAVVGLGAVGSYAVEALARAGVGRLRLVDFDVVRESNVNRQLYALGSTLGQRKVDVARARVLDINPDCAVECLPLFVHTDTLAPVVAKPLDLLIDAIDSVRPKTELIAGAVRAGIPVISVMGAALRSDPAAIRAGDLEETSCCPLARFVRKGLRRRGVTGGVRCIYSLEPLPESAAGASAPKAAEEEGGAEALRRGRPRKALGSLSSLTGMFGLWAATEAVLALSGWKPRGGPGAGPAGENLRS